MSLPIDFCIDYTLILTSIRHSSSICLNDLSFLEAIRNSASPATKRPGYVSHNCNCTVYLSRKTLGLNLFIRLKYFRVYSVT